MNTTLAMWTDRHRQAHDVPLLLHRQVCVTRVSVDISAQSYVREHV